MTSKKKQIDAEFSSAYDNWNLEKLYSDLAATKKKMLTPVEKSLLRGLLNSYSPAEIANIVYQSRNSSTVRVYLSNGLYKYIEELLSSRTGNSVKIQNWSRVAYLLEKAGYKKVTQPLTNRPLSAVTAPAAWQPDWGEAIDVSVFYGRTRELRSLETWIVADRCRLVAILGMGGIGKTALSVKIAEHIQDKFYVIWRSLAHAPPVTEILAQLIEFFAPNANIPNNIHSSISQLIQYLRDRRCLLVLDNSEAVLTSQEQSFAYREGYAGYAELVRRIGESSHQSCLVLTSREAPKEISTLQGATLPTRALKLTGLSSLEATSILHSKGIVNFSETECNQLVDCYAGNPLFLKIIATVIQDLFASNVSLFLKHNNIIFSDIREVLNQQFHRLSELEKQVLYWLTLNPEQNLLDSQLDIIRNVSRAEILDAIAALQKRSLLDHNSIKLDIIFIAYIVKHLSDQLIQKNNSVQAVTIFTKSRIESYLNDWIISKSEKG